jgi:aryl-alcohol dehydrogenase-like predicted oxidoreductase
MACFAKRGTTMAMQLDHYRLLGRSGLRVSPLCLGTMTFGTGPGAWGSSDAEAAQIVDRYVELGGNFIDTANFYGRMGQSEVLLGQLVKSRRERLVLSTKYTLTTRPGDPNASGNQRRNMVRAVEDSLRRLDTDFIDLYYLHMWDFRTPIDEILRAFDDLVTAGKIVYIGLSDIPAWEASRMQMMAELRGWSQFCALQISYSLAERTVERELVPMAQATGMGVCPWSPLGGGVLTGKYSRADLVAAEGADRSSRKVQNLASGRLTEQSLAIAAVVSAVAREQGKSPAQIALAWLLTRPGVTSPVLGARTPAQLEDNLGALKVELSADQQARLDAVSAVPKVFPFTMLRGPAEGMMFGGVTVEERQ